jgi:hypothetical protein
MGQGDSFKGGFLRRKFLPIDSKLWKETLSERTSFGRDIYLERASLFEDIPLKGISFGRLSP